MARSHDRVEFKLTDNITMAAITVRAASFAFGIPEDEAHILFTNGATISCRPSQFGRFIVRRAELVREALKAPYPTSVNNRIAQMNATIIHPQEIQKIIDLSDNRHHY